MADLNNLSNGLTISLEISKFKAMSEFLMMHCTFIRFFIWPSTVIVQWHERKDKVSYG